MTPCLQSRRGWGGAPSSPCNTEPCSRQYRPKMLPAAVVLELQLSTSRAPADCFIHLTCSVGVGIKQARFDVLEGKRATLGSLPPPPCETVGKPPPTTPENVPKPLNLTTFPKGTPDIRPHSRACWGRGGEEDAGPSLGLGLQLLHLGRGVGGERHRLPIGQGGRWEAAGARVLSPPPHQRAPVTQNLSTVHTRGRPSRSLTPT